MKIYRLTADQRRPAPSGDEDTAGPRALVLSQKSAETQFKSRRNCFPPIEDVMAVLDRAATKRIHA